MLICSLPTCVFVAWLCMVEVWYTIYKEAKLKVQLSCLSHAYVGSNMLMWVDCGVHFGCCASLLDAAMAKVCLQTGDQFLCPTFNQVSEQ